MGYTHYWYRETEIAPEAWDAITSEVTRIIEESHIPIVGWDGESELEINDNVIWLNGIGADAHETFVIERVIPADRQTIQNKQGLHFDFCKTNRKPYDLVVMASLLAMKRHLGQKIQISSDGDVIEWRPAGELYGRVCGGKWVFEKAADTQRWEAPDYV